MNLVESLERQMLKPAEALPELRPGDTVRVYLRIVEGERERVQVFQGTIIRLRGGGVNRSCTVRRIAAHGVGVERTFLLHSPRVEKIEVVRRAKVRRAKLYYLRERRGKAARLKEKR
ncbi:MAG: 50S ribosomal protein L19 [Anaerolineae bacterium]